MNNRFVRRGAGAPFRIKTLKIPDLLIDSNGIGPGTRGVVGLLFYSAHQELSINILADRGIS